MVSKEANENKKKKREHNVIYMSLIFAVVCYHAFHVVYPFS